MGTRLVLPLLSRKSLGRKLPALSVHYILSVVHRWHLPLICSSSCTLYSVMSIGYFTLQDLSPSFYQHEVPMPDPFDSDSNTSAFLNISVSSLSDGSTVTTRTASVSSETPCWSDNIDDVHMNDPFQNSFVYDCSFDDDSMKLFPSSELTVVKSLALLFSWFCSFPGISKEAFGRLLYLLNTFLLPTGNTLPNSYQKARATINHLLVPTHEYDCCVNDCIIFRKCAEGDSSHLSSCPKCDEPRYHPCSKVARKKFKYIPLAPRIKRMFANKTVSKLLQSHQEEIVTQVVTDLHQSPAWKSRYDNAGPFHGDPRGISLSLCTDGTNPFSKEKVAYSMWPITLEILNLPHQIRRLPGSIMLAGIIPGKSEPQNLDPYLEILVDELCSLNGLELFDGYHEEKFLLNVDILLHVLDYPGQNKVFHCHGK